MNNKEIEAAAGWFARIRSDDMSENDRRKFEEWLDASPAHRNAYTEIENTWERAGLVSDYFKSDSRAGTMSVSEKSSISGQHKKLVKTKGRWFIGVIVIGILSSYLFVSHYLHQ